MTTFNSPNIIFYNKSDIKWQIIIKPNVRFDEIAIKGLNYCEFWIRFPDLSSNIKSIIAIFKIQISANGGKIGRSIKAPHSFNAKSLAMGNPEYCVPLKELEKYDSLMVESYLDIMNIEIDETSVNPVRIPILSKQDIPIDKKIVYEWIIDNDLLNEWKSAKPGNKYQSNTFGIGGNWCLTMLPNGDDWKGIGYTILGLDSLRMGEKSGTIIKCKCKLTMLADKKKIEFWEEAQFDYDDYDYAWIWPENTFSHDQLQKISSLKIIVKIWDIGRTFSV